MPFKVGKNRVFANLLNIHIISENIKEFQILNKKYI